MNELSRASFLRRAAVALGVAFAGVDLAENAAPAEVAPPYFHLAAVERHHDLVDLYMESRRDVIVKVDLRHGLDGPPMMRWLVPPRSFVAYSFPHRTEIDPARLWIDASSGDGSPHVELLRPSAVPGILVADTPHVFVSAVVR